MAQVTVHFGGEKVSVSSDSYEGNGFSDGDAEVTFDDANWWRVIEALQDWLGECPHCGKLVGAKPAKGLALADVEAALAFRANPLLEGR